METPQKSNYFKTPPPPKKKQKRCHTEDTAHLRLESENMEKPGWY